MLLGSIGKSVRWLIPVRVIGRCVTHWIGWIGWIGRHLAKGKGRPTPLRKTIHFPPVKRAVEPLLRAVTIEDISLRVL
jgi:hypothetical protein